MKFGIVTDSSCDLPESYTAQEEVTVVSFYVSFDGENYLKEGKEAGITEFYQKMADNPDCYPKTSMPSVQDYIDAFLPVVKKDCRFSVYALPRISAVPCSRQLLPKKKWKRNFHRRK